MRKHCIRTTDPATGPASWILGNWSAIGVFYAFTGTPFNPTGGGACNCPGGTQTPNQVKSEVVFLKSRFVGNARCVFLDAGNVGKNVFKTLYRVARRYARPQPLRFFEHAA